jgi:hypothetical protein
MGRQEDNMTFGIQYIRRENVDGIQPARDRVHRLALLNVVMELQDSINGGEFHG